MIELTKVKGFPTTKNVEFRTIITTNNSNENTTVMEESQIENFNVIKKSILGTKEKALVIQLN